MISMKSVWRSIIISTFALLLLFTVNAQLINFTLEPDILQSKEITLNYGQSLQLRAELSGPKLLEARNITMKMKIAETGYEKYFTKEAHNIYTLKATIPDNRLYEKILIHFELRAELDQEVIVRRWVNVNLTDKLNIEIVEPSGSIFGTGTIERIKAKVNYYNMQPFDKEKLLAEVIVDKGIEKKVELVKEGDLYVAQLPEPIQEGNHEIALRLIGSYKGVGVVNTQPNIILPIIVFILIFGLSVFAYKKIVSRLMISAEISAAKEPVKKSLAKEEIVLPIERKEPVSQKSFLDVVVPSIKKEKDAGVLIQKEKIAEPKEEKRLEEFVIEKPKPTYEIPISKTEKAESKEIIQLRESSELKKEVKEEQATEEKKETTSALFPLFMPKRKTK
ncbi:MAG: hypothetical protein QXM75_02175 [Candidatus Diapherotrites archaeon]